MAGQLAARERGRLPGRIRSLSAEEEGALVAEYQTGKTTYKGLSVKYGISQSAAKRAVYRVVKSSDYLKRMKC
ncbi:hypothetical protein D3C78_1826460 [compost metagenome]